MKHALLATFMILASFASAFAQQDPNAQKILDAMKAKYEAMAAFEATITQEVLSAKDEILGKFEAKATVKKNKYKLDLGDQVIYNNERTVWRHLVDEEEVTIHNNNSEAEGEEAFQSPARLYKLYKDGFKYVLMGTETVNGTSCDVIELSPTERKKFDFFKVKLFVNKTDKTLVRWIIFEKDKAGIVNKYRYTVKNFKANVQVSDQFFSFDKSKYPKVEVIEMRD